MKSKQINKLATAALLAAVALSGCTTAVKKDDATVVQERAIQRWNLLIAHKAEQAYDYLSPGYRSTQPRDAYAKIKNSSPVRWESVKPLDNKCDGETCTVRLVITSKVVLPQLEGHDVESQSPVTERWLKSDGQWYFLPEEASKPAQKKS